MRSAPLPDTDKLPSPPAEITFNKKVLSWHSQGGSILCIRKIAFIYLSLHMDVLLLTHIDAQTSLEGQKTWPLLTSLLTQTHIAMSQQSTDLVDRKVFGSSSGSENNQRKKSAL